MTKEEAREAIKDAFGNSEYTDELIKTLEQEPRWIPTEEKLPEVNEEAYSKDVLLSLRRETKWDIDTGREVHITTIGHYDMNAISSDGIYLDTEGWILENQRRLPLSDVIAWRPLFPQYKEIET